MLILKQESGIVSHPDFYKYGIEQGWKSWEQQVYHHIKYYRIVVKVDYKLMLLKLNSGINLKGD